MGRKKVHGAGKMRGEVNYRDVVELDKTECKIKS